MTCKHEEFYVKLCALVHRYTDSLAPVEVAYLLVGEGAHILYMCARPEAKEEAIRGLIDKAINDARTNALLHRSEEKNDN